MSTTLIFEELREAGLLETPDRLTTKGWDWLRCLEAVRGTEAAESDWAAELVLSVNGLSR